jgi:hypothetical protein
MHRYRYVFAVSGTIAFRMGTRYGSCKVNTRRPVQKMPPVFFSENLIAVNMKFTWIIHTSFAIIRLFFPQSPHHFQHSFANVE